MNFTLIKSIITEYGLPWAFNRFLYSLKLKMMNTLPVTENFFEKKVQVKRLDIFNFDTEPIEDFLNKLPEDKKEKIISIADNAIKGKILGFSSIELDYGNPINWHLNPLTNKEVDKSLKWYKIPDFDQERGDIKVIWEASRFTHLFYFIRAYILTKDAKYYEAFSDQLASWLRENPYSYGANYKCGQEATLRMINVLIAYSAFKSYGLITKKDEENVRKIVEGSYKKVLSNFFYAHKCIKNNHTLSEITGLIIGAWACGDTNKLKRAYKLMDKEIEKQFISDGGYKQFSFNYQRFALQIIEFVLKINNKTGMDLSEHTKKLIKNSALLMYQMQDDSGDVPNYGSNDGALIFPVTTCGYRDFRPVLNTIFSFIDGKRIYEPGEYDEELLWFGNKGIEEIPCLEIERRSSSFHESGFYSFRHKNGFLMTVLQDFKSRPAQMDQLHIDLWHKGINVFCDSGTYSYATEIGKQLSLTSAHNTVVIPDKEQMSKHGPFLIYNWSLREKVKYETKRFIGTMISKNGYKHTREIKQTDYGYLIVDQVYSEDGNCMFYFHTPCEINTISSKEFELSYKGEPICNIKTSFDAEVNKAYRSLYYLKKEIINCIEVKGKMIDQKCEAEFVIELY
ncbi:heparinase II/III domain-containing protein [Ureibacillus terrenus]|uniref:Uncharacterized protein n=1 Tax=Ureibacillus terrenus TaxID=118246 RepID=A0A540V2J0_9BACL|nr:heparinase II/III family protein [Ureibacillus terrenus]TQE90937.1 hypothetical protein FKZ59_07995 [Ureibacillus terrenus]